jgi:dipeptide/tripeptide permease
MLQRIQTLWLLLASACALLTLKFPFFSGARPGANQANPIDALSATSTIPIVVLTVGLAIGMLIVIFLFKNRKLQLRLTVVGILVSIVIIFLYYLETKNFTDGHYALSAIFSIAIPVLLSMAARGIRKDQKLVKSLDRLR